MDPYAYRIEEIDPARDSRIERVREFLARQGLSLDPGLSGYFAVFSGDRLVGGAGYDGNVVKCAAVDPEYRGEGILNAVVSRLTTVLHEQGRDDLFVFTKPENLPFFRDLGFVPLEKTPDVLLLESDARAFPAYLDGIRKRRRDGVAGAVVMNCNPFTKGHRYLIEQAAAECDSLLLFAVEAERSEFPFDVRIRLMREGTADLPKVAVLSGGPYIVSAATFPTYFLKDASAAARAQTELDATLFGRHIAPAGGITRRFVGEEPFSPVTDLYNRTLARILPTFGVSLSVIPRLEEKGVAISASAVRRLLREGDLEGVRDLVPETTFRYLERAIQTPPARGGRRISS